LLISAEIAGPLDFQDQEKNLSPASALKESVAGSRGFAPRRREERKEEKKEEEKPVLL
jgi:hypothetical protein